MDDKKTQQKIEQLQYLQQNLSQIGMQKQTFQSQQLEIDSALKELPSSEKSFKIVGTIMVDVAKSDLEKELSDKNEMLQLRIKTLEKQETKMQEKAAIMQQNIMTEMKQ